MTDDAINHPTHYGGEDNVYEAIKVIEAWDLGFCLGNTVKYIARAGKKDDIIQDLKKAEWYLLHEIGRLEHERDAELQRHEADHVIADSYWKIIAELNKGSRPRVRASGRSHGKRPKRGALSKAVVRRRVASGRK